MSVKPGDLAIVRAPGLQVNGRIVEVLYVAPTEDFLLPDGTLNKGAGNEVCFVCKGIGGPLHALRDNGAPWTGWYAGFHHAYLRPLPGDETPESETRRDEVEA